MLKQLLKYEFKATKSLYFGLYLALALLSVVLGVTFRQEHALAHSTSFQNLEVILMIVYVSVILAIAVLCFVNTIISNYSKDATVVISTHLIEDIETVLDEAVFLKDGRIFAHRAVDDIRETEGKSVDAYFREVFKC